MTKDKTIVQVLIISSIPLFFYTAFRACTLSFTSDESYTYIEYVAKNFTTFSHYGSFDANNHILNTWLMELSSKLFGASEFYLRLPNVLAHIIFLYYSAKFVRNFSSGILVFGSFLILNLNPFLLDFFSLARGYGISMALMMGSIYYAYGYITQQKSMSYAFYSILFAAIALLSYFLMLNYLLIITLLFIMVYFQRNHIGNKNSSTQILQHSKAVLFLISPLSILFFALPVMFRLKEAKAFAFGEQHGFWSDTVCSLIANDLYEDNVVNFALTAVEIGVVVLLFISILVFIFVIIMKDKRAIHSFFIFIFSVLFLCLIANFIEHKWMEILFLRGRYALYYFLLFMVLMLLLFNLIYIELKGRWRFFCIGLFIMTTLVFTGNFINAANFQYVNNWKKEADVKDMFQTILKSTDKKFLDKGTIIVGVASYGWLFVSDFKFYTDLNKNIRFNNSGAIDFKNSETDFLFLEPEDFINLHPDTTWMVMKNYPASEMVLVANKKRLKN